MEHEEPDLTTFYNPHGGVVSDIMSTSWDSGRVTAAISRSQKKWKQYRSTTADQS